MKDKISIIVPVYNTEKYLKECIESLINQTYKNIEIILINDGSTDGSGKICDEYRKKDKRVKVIHQENRGLSITRNYGIKISSGKYISFVDSDDVIHFKMIELLHKEIIATKSQIAVCKFQTFYDKYLEKEEKYKVQVMKRQEFLKRLMFDKEITSHACNKLYERSLFENVEFVPFRKFEDIGTIYKFGFIVDSVCYLDIKLYGYRIRNDSIVNNLKKETLIDYIDMVNGRYDDMIIKNNDLKIYIDMNRINSITRYFLMIAMHDKKEMFNDKEIKDKLDRELIVARRLRRMEVIKVNSLIENVASKLLIISPNLFFWIMKNFYKLKRLVIRWIKI